MKTDLKKENLKAAVVMLNGRLNFHTTEVTPMELTYLKQMLVEKYGRTVHFVSKETRKELRECHREDYRQVEDTDLNDYDEVYIFNTSINLFGGTYQYINLVTFKKLLSFKGKIYYVLSDPRFPCKDFGHYMKKRLEASEDGKHLQSDRGPTDIITKEDCDKWTNEIFPEITIAFNGFDYERLYKEYTKSKRKCNHVKYPSKCNWCQLMYFQQFGKKLMEEDKTILLDHCFEDKKYDLCYYGVNRKNERNEIIASLYAPKELSKLFIGLDVIDVPNSKIIERTEREDLFPTICKNCLATVVIGDNYHNNNCITFRFYEAMLMDAVGLIYDAYDTDRKLIKNKFLLDFIYVKTADDVVDRLKRLREDKALYKKIIKLEREEVKRIFSEV